jgi:acetyl esterase/lipase
MTLMPAAEMPMALAASHAIAAWRSSKDTTPQSRYATAVNTFAALGFLSLVGDTRRSASALRRALGETGYEYSPANARRVVPGPAARFKFLRHANVAFSPQHGKLGHLDIWHRPDLPTGAKAPVLLQVHGGAWSLGDKHMGGGTLGHFARQGWVCVSVNYRLGPAARWPAMIIDVKRAIAWTREHIAQYGGDPAFIAITGQSAGAHLAALAALSPNDPAYQPGFEEADTSIAAAATLYGIYDLSSDVNGLWKLLEDVVFDTTYATDTHGWQQASPILRITPDAPPFLVVHGSTDAIVPVEQSRAFVGKLREISRSAVGYAEPPHAQHGFDTFPSTRAALTIDAMHQFLVGVHADMTRNRRREIANRDGSS